MIILKKIEAVLKIMIASLFLVLFIYPRDVYAQQCNNDGVECCVLDANDVCTGSTFPGDCDGSCNATCGGAGFVGGGCSWDGGSTPPTGGGCYDGRVNCPSGWTVSLGQPLSNNCSIPGRMCGPGTAQRETGCCHGGIDPDTGEEVCFKAEYTTYRCCAPGTIEQCQNVTGTHVFNKIFNATLGGGPEPKDCPAGEAFLSSRLLSCYNGQPWIPKEGWTTYCVHEISCRTVTRVCSCVPNCSVVAPSVPTLTSPANGASITSTQNSLTWNVSSQTWGNNCGVANNTYSIYVGPNPASLSLYGTTLGSTGSIPHNGVSGNNYCWRVRANNGAATTDSAVWCFTINAFTTPWWQVKDGDVTTNSDITSPVPATSPVSYFNTIGLGGFPGVPVFGGVLNVTNNISTTGWNADTATTQSRIFNYSYFENLIPDDVNFNNISNLASGGTPYSDGYYWFRVTGNTTIASDTNINNRKVILFVENGNLTINGRINLNDGSGFFGAFVDGNIVVGNSVAGTPSLEGVYLSNGSFSSGAGTSQLHIRGSVASFGGVNLQRDLANDVNPAELFEFAPDQMMLFPEKLMFRRTKWQEVAP